MPQERGGENRCKMQNAGFVDLPGAKGYINVLEMKAAEFMIWSFAKKFENVHIHLKVDNTLAHINNIGGMVHSTTERVPECV